ncbi:MAG: hypothetical protein FJX65_11780 [Alphaproteobacteria bacterium]|nr:hypothetical protein [Alphaproteobacteria bacterium]
MVRRGLAVSAVSAVALALAGATQAAELRVGHSSFPAALGNALPDTSHSAGFTFFALYDTLTFGAAAGTEPRLATSWRNTSPTTWEMKLRPNVKFHNGKTFEASDVADLIAYMNGEEGKTKGANTFNNMTNVVGARAIDPGTVEIRTATPDAMLPAVIAILKMYDMKYFREAGWDNYGPRPIGTGPYRAVSWSQDRIEFAPFKEGWRPGKIDKMTFRNLPELAARVQAFQSNQVDLAFQVVADSKGSVELAGGRLHVSQAPQVLTLMIFQNKPGHPVADVRVRQALNHAVNRDAYIKNIMGGLTVPGGQPGARSVNGYDPELKPYAYDPEQAKRLLSAAGFDKGLNLSGDVVVNVSELRDVYQQVAADLQRVGVNLTLNVITLADLLQRVRDPSKFGDSTLFSFNFGSEPTMDIMRSINALHSCNARTKWICFQDIEPTIKAVNEEFDPAKRKQLLLQVARYYRENAPAIFLHEEVQVDAVSNKVRGYNPVNRLVNWHEIDLQ